MSLTDGRFDVAFSFASENSDYVDEFADLLERHGVNIFIDRTDRVGLWGRNLYDHLTQIVEKLGQGKRTST